MLLKAFGKFAGGFLALIAGFVLLSFMCRGETCGEAISFVASWVSDESSRNIIPVEPPEGSTVSSPFAVRGTARVFEGTVFYTLEDAAGTLLAEGTLKTQGKNMQEFLPFAGSVSYGNPGTPAGTLTLYDVSPKDGSVIDRTVVRVSFSP